MDPLQVWGPTLVGAGLLGAMLALCGAEARSTRIVSATLCIVLALRYIAWRVLFSMPTGQGAIQQLWAWVFLLFESLAIFSSINVYLFMSRHIDRRPLADARRHSKLTAAPTDIFIATYNEGYEILERTIVGALHVAHPDLRVWVLDDGARAWVAELAAELGTHYVSRVKGKHAKAGNVNNGLAQALATGRRPQFLLLLDADFVPARRILQRTLGLFEEADVGIVQTPQHFFNPDPIQANLLCATAWPDEQRFFFNHLMPCKDAWGAAFCCGTSAVFRVAALEAAGGMATETVTEDMLTSFKFEELGYRTIFLNERLSLGLAPEGLSEYIGQRGRWCLGAIQQLHTRWSFAGSARISAISRLSTLDTALYWGATFPFKLMMISAPLLFWWTGTAVLTSTMDDLIYQLAPFVACSMIFMATYSGNRVLPVMTDAMQLLPALTVIRTVATGLVRPWGRPFKVTAKGLSSDRFTVQWRFMLPFLGLAAATLAGMLANLSVFSPRSGSPAFEVNVFWGLFNIAVLLITALVCVELPRRRRDERFATGEPGILVQGGRRQPVRVRDISLGGARLACPAPTTAAGELLLDGGAAAFALIPVGIEPDQLTVRFAQDAATRRRLIARLFTGDYDNEVPRVRPMQLAGALLRKLFA